MLLSIHMVLDELADYKPMALFSDLDNRYFYGLRLYEPDMTVLSSELLYLCDWQALDSCGIPDDDVCVLCVSSDGNNVDIPDALNNKHIVLIPNCTSRVEIFNRVISLFNTLRDWHMNMHLALIQFNDINKIFELSESIIGNPIVLVDLSFKLMACTRNIETDDKVYNDLVSRGFHSSETVERFTESQTVTRLKNSKHVVINFPHDITPYQTVTKTFEIDGIPCAYMRMICSGREPTRSMLELFDLLSESVEFYLRNHFSKDDVNRYMYEYVLIDLIESENIDAAAMEERIKYIGLEYESDYRLMYLAFEQVENTSLTYVLDQLIALFPSSHPFIYGNCIIMLMNFRSKFNSLEEIRQSQFKRMEEFLTQHRAYAGLSNSFSTLHMVRNAYTQALNAIGIGRGLQLKKQTYKPRPENTRIFEYDDYYVYHMFSACAKEVSLESLCNNSLLSIADNDRKNGTNMAFILYTYLQNERKPTDTAKVLHMHRNNVIYHIGRIEKAYGLDLDDPYARLRLLLSYKALDLLPDNGE